MRGKHVQRRVRQRDERLEELRELRDGVPGGGSLPGRLLHVRRHRALLRHRRRGRLHPDDERRQQLRQLRRNVRSRRHVRGRRLQLPDRPVGLHGRRRRRRSLLLHRRVHGPEQLRELRARLPHNRQLRRRGLRFLRGSEHTHSDHVRRPGPLRRHGDGRQELRRLQQAMPCHGDLLQERLRVPAG